MITADAAREIARRHVQSAGEDLVLLDKPITSGHYGWVFLKKSESFVETSDVSGALAGNAPILVDINKRQIVTLGTAHDVDRYVFMYQRFGDPHAEPDQSTNLSDRRDNVERFSLVPFIFRNY